MTTLSASAAATNAPKQSLLDTISSRVASGQISRADQTALASAVKDLDGALTDAPLDPSGMGSRIDALVAGEVAKGTLTRDQGDKLRQILGQGGAGASPPGPPPPQGTATGGADPSGTSADDVEASAASTSGAASALLGKFIHQLQTVQGPASGYAADGQTGAGKRVGGLLLNFEA